MYGVSTYIYHKNKTNVGQILSYGYVFDFFVDPYLDYLSYLHSCATS